MPREILMPALSPTMTEGKIVRWLKKEGDAVAVGQVLAEVETDKATMEVEATEAGRLAKILVPAGTEGIKVQSTIAILLDEGEDFPEDIFPKSKDDAVSQGHPKSGKDVRPSLPANDAAQERLFVSPLARRIAEQAGIDLSQIPGTGPNGRIILADVEIYIANMKAKTNVKQTAASLKPNGTGVLPPRSSAVADVATKKEDKPSAASSQDAPVAATAVVSPRGSTYTLSIDCELDELVKLQKSVNETYRAEVSLTDCAVRAVALALRKVPAANVSTSGEQREHSNVSVAVATPKGFVTPTIAQVEDKSLMEISSAMEEFSSQLRGGRLTGNEETTASVVVQSLDSLSVLRFSSSLRSPYVCSLAIGAATQRPIVKDGKIAVATVVTCVLTADGAVVNELVGAEFLSVFKPLIEQPYGLLV